MGAPRTGKSRVLDEVKRLVCSGEIPHMENSLCINTNYHEHTESTLDRYGEVGLCWRLLKSLVNVNNDEYVTKFKDSKIGTVYF